ncbi:hypothetical protein ACFL9S_22945 [Erwinia sp. AnSW2-5]|uniref:DUF7446 family protein n=1 Tax=Erwinia sp. AnSW2-5 TaxID=3367692 RepID=UPI00385F004A
MLIESWGNKPDWPFIFDSDNNETHVMREYKLAWIEQAGLTLNGCYNISTQQRGFAVSFSTNSPTELKLKKQIVEFILTYLKTDERHEKVLSVYNLDTEDCAWSLFCNQNSGQFGLAKERRGSRVNRQYSTHCMAALAISSLFPIPILSPKNYNLVHRSPAMTNPITVGVSPLTNTIFAGRSKPMLKGPAEARIFVGDKFDVTQQALATVAQHLVKRDNILIIPVPDGRVIHLRADVKEATMAKTQIAVG